MQRRGQPQVIVGQILPCMRYKESCVWLHEMSGMLFDHDPILNFVYTIISQIAPSSTVVYKGHSLCSSDMQKIPLPTYS